MKIINNSEMSECDRYYNPDNIFKKFKVIEFPISFVGLSTERYLDVEANLANAAYLKTMCNGSLMEFSEAREISPSHRAFDLKQVNDNIIQISFKPMNECISKVKNQKGDKGFIFDLHLIQIDGVRCCTNELHSEISRYYIIGKYEYCKLSHYPKEINFGEVVMNTEETQQVSIRNDSNFICAKVEYVKVFGIEVLPDKFVIPPNLSKRLCVKIKPTCLKSNNTIKFEVRNSHNIYDDNFEILRGNEINTESNFISYSIKCKLNVIYKKETKNLVIESMHKLNEPDIRYTFIDEVEINQQRQRKKEAFKHLQICKSNYTKKQIIEKNCNGRDKCYSDLSVRLRKLPENFCKTAREHINTLNVFDVLFLPYEINFGRVGLHTYGKQEVIIKNNTKFNITIQLQNDACILYTNKKLSTFSIKLSSFRETKVTIFCEGFLKGLFKGTFIYMIDNKFSRKHPYFLQVGNPTLMLKEKTIKFGMITSDCFVTSVPVKIYNEFNTSVDFKWDELHSDVPFDIFPKTGTVPGRSCMICDVMYICNPTKTKTFEIDFISQSTTSRTVSVELNIITRKLAIKFLQAAVIFKDIALNIETIEIVKLENSSREIVAFFVVEPLIPGFKIEPMIGNIQPKMVITFQMIVQISCVLEFAFDVIVKINNKENVTIPVSGNVIEPKILIYPKNINMTRIPCDMMTYVPVTFQNISTLDTVVEVLDTDDENMFDVYIDQGQEKYRIFKFIVGGGQSKTVFIKVLDIVRREYDMYIPFKINRLLGPPDANNRSTELQYYIGKYESQYELNSRVIVKSPNKEISFCRIMGVITLSWIRFSVNKFEILYDSNKKNEIAFTMTNISKYCLNVTIMTAKLSPNFTLEFVSEEYNSIVNESNIKFDLDHGKQAAFILKFHPRMLGRFASTATLFLDKDMVIPYYNLTFIGKRQHPEMTPSTHNIIFPPCHVGTAIARTLTVKMGFIATLNQFSCLAKEEPNLIVKFLSCKVLEPKNEALCTILTVEIIASSNKTYTRNIIITIIHECGSACEIKINFCFTSCVLTLHTHFHVKPDDNPYPYFPNDDQNELYNYMVTCTNFLEKWMFQQGFRRDLYPVIPDTFYAISNFLCAPSNGTKSKSTNVTFLSFIKRIAGPLIKYIRKTRYQEVEEKYKNVKEIHDTYQEIINLIRSRGSNLWVLQAKFMLSYDQFVLYSEYATPKHNADILLTRELLEDVNLFNRLTKQSWIDFILQTYKAFVLDSCFFDCVCVSDRPRDIVNILINWFNENIAMQHSKFRGNDKPVKKITNLTTDLSDGIALTSALLNFCPFLADHFDMFFEVEDDNSEVAVIINNACLIIEAMNHLRLYFPLNSKDFLEPNFLQMLFLSIHFYITLPMFKPRDVIKFNPPLLRSSTRHVKVSPTSHDSLTFTYTILKNNKNSFSVEKCQAGDNGKKIFVNVKYIANFVDEENCVLLVHGYNKTRIFDTYMVFLLKGCVEILNPVTKCKVTGSLYRLNRVDIPVSSPFTVDATFSIHITDTEPSMPIVFKEKTHAKFYVRRLNLIDTEITLHPIPKDNSQKIPEQKLYLQLMCLSTQVGNSWIWFRSEIGEFFVRVTTQPRWDMAVNTLQINMQNWPMEPCSCGEVCECYRTNILMIPHRNELMVKALRYALLEHTTDIMMNIFDQFIETETGNMVLRMLLADGGTNMSEVQHILCNEIKYRISSKTLTPKLDRVVLAHHTNALLPLPLTLAPDNKSEKHSVTFTSECGMDIRTYKILFVEMRNYKSDSG